jgi:hypothetical protein
MSTKIENIEKTLRYAAGKNLSALVLGKLLTQKHDITPAEATRWMDEYRKKYPQTANARVFSQLKKQKTHPIPGPVTSRINKGENVQSVPDLTAEIQVTNQEVRVVNFSPPNRDIGSNYQPSILNRSAVKSFALAASEQNRAGKFKRCSPAFIQAVEAEVEALLREIGGNQPEQDVPGEYSFINCKRAFAKAEQQFNLAVRKIILRRVKSQPSNGQTLK